MLDRTICPKISDIEGIVVPEVKSESLANGIQLHSFKVGTMPLLDISFLIGVGKADQEIRFQNSYTADLLKAGAKGKSTNEVAEVLDFFGAAIFSFPYINMTEIKVTLLAHQLPNVVEIIRDCIFYPSFEQAELERKYRQERLKMEQNLKKTNYAVSQELQRLIYGDEIWAKYENRVMDCDKVSREDLLNHHKKFYYPENMEIFLGEDVTEDAISLIKRTFEEVPATGKARRGRTMPTISPYEPQRVVKHIEGVQSTVLMSAICGKSGDFDLAFQIRFIAFMLGGSLTSRLAPIREEFGYTYGIHANVESVGGNLILNIIANCDNKYAKPLIEEVYHQFDRLESEPITEEELHKAKNLYMGECLEGSSVQTFWIDALTSQVVSYPDREKNFDLMLQREKMLKALTAEKVNEVCRKFLVKERFYEVVAGEPVGM